jgi:hypothetical protein
VAPVAGDAGTDIEKRGTVKQLLAFRGVADDPQGVLTAVKRGDLRPRHYVNNSRCAGDGYSSGFLDRINADNLKRPGHPFQQNWVAQLRDVRFWHMPQVSHRPAFNSSPVEIKRHHYFKSSRRDQKVSLLYASWARC